VGTARLQVQEAERSGKLVLRATDVGYAYGDNAVVRGFSVTIMRGDKIGIIGPNGAGKTTLLQLLLGELTPQHGQVEQGTRLAVAYFDQLRTPLDEDKTVQEIVGRGDDYIPFNGRDRHIMGYLRDFLFSADRVRSPVSVLSGGERNRLLLARLFSQPSNVLVLDEPTNDLDAETLELLEELLLEYTGTVLLVSHDRMFLNNVATSTLVFEDEGQINEYVGGYDDWLRQRWPAQPADSAPTQPDQKKSLPRRDRTPRPRKLSYKEQRELEELPQRIETLESEQAAVHATLADPELYRQGGEKFAALHARLTILEQELEAAYQRWETLEAIPQ
jgi:ATP-binding cassette subfamily F protein uup